MEERLQLHVTSLAPPHIVDEIVNAFVVSARKLGHDVTYAPSSARQGALNIICFALGMNPKDLHAYPDRIILNFEPLAPGAQAHVEHNLELLRDNYVWEYSRNNLAAYSELGISAGCHVPLGYEEDADVNVPLHDIS